MLDALDGVTAQDKAIAGEAVKEGKPIVIVVNKWDLVTERFRKEGSFKPYASERDYREKYEKALFDRLFFTPGAPLIAGLNIASTQPKRVLVRAVGRGLEGFGLTGVLARPTLTLYRGETPLVANTGWTTRPDSTITAHEFLEIGAFRLDAADAGFVTHLPAGAYTAVVTSADNSTGTALVEIYELP